MNILEALDRPIAFHRIFAQITGSPLAGLFLSQAWYWSSRTSDPEGWFYKTSEEWESETCLKRKQQLTARKILKNMGVLEEKRVGIPAKLYYRVERTVLASTIEAFLSKKQAETLACQQLGKSDILDGQIGHSSVAGSDILDGQIGHSIYITETTTEITAETTEERERDARANSKIDFDEYGQGEPESLGSDRPPPDPSPPQAKAPVKNHPSGEGQGSAAPPPELKIQNWDEFVAPGHSPAFWRWLCRTMQLLPTPPAIPESAGEAWVRREGVKLWGKYLETLQSPETFERVASDHDRLIAEAAERDRANLQRLKGNPDIQRQAMLGGLPPPEPTPQRDMFSEAVAALESGDCTEALAQIRGHQKVCKFSFAGVFANLQAEGKLPPSANDLSLMDDAQILEVLKYTTQLWKLKLDTRYAMPSPHQAQALSPPGELTHA